MIGILILTHGDFGENLLKTATVIMKDKEKALSLNLSRRLDFNNLRKQVLDKIKEIDAVDGIVVLIDAYGGTSYNTTLPLLKDQNICIVTGVNLPMVLSAITNRRRMALVQLAQKISDDAKKTISVLSEV